MPGRDCSHIQEACNKIDLQQLAESMELNGKETVAHQRTRTEIYEARVQNTSSAHTAAMGNQDENGVDRDN
jgi:hypothetical protein